MTATLNLVPGLSAAQDQPWPPAVWTQPTAPFHIAGPIYYVGGLELTAYLLVDEACAILVNVGMDENVPLVLDSVRELGFEPESIQYLLITQAHFDHAGGAQAIAKQTSATVLAGMADVQLLKAGGMGDYVFGDELPFPAVPKAQAVDNGERVQCGDLTVEALATPGHTPGSTSWRVSFDDAGKTQVALIAASVSVLPQAQLVDNPLYAHVEQDFRNTYQTLLEQRYHYYLPDHLVFVNPRDHSQPNPNWFKTRDALPKWIQRSQTTLEKQLMEQRNGEQNESGKD